MNERIQELIGQCIDQRWTVTGPMFDKEKFAELIVAECGHCMVDIMLYGGIEPEEGYDIMMKRFGVQE
jgi:hypothetical protein